MKKYSLYDADMYNDFKTFIDRKFEKYKNKPAITTYNEAGEISTKTYKEMMCDIYALAEEFANKGLANKHTAIISQNSYMYVVSFFAILYIGGTVIPVDTEQSTSTIKFMISFADTDFILVSESMLEDIQSEGILEKTPFVILSENKNIKGGFYETLENGNKLIAERGRMCKDVVISPDEKAVIIYTSGTTNVSKPVVLSQKAILVNAIEATKLVKLPEKFFSSLPLYHAYGLTCAFISSMANGSELCLNGDLRYMLRDFMVYKPEGIMAVPLIVETLYKYIMNGYSFPELKMIICGGAHLSVKIAKSLNKCGIRVQEGYGITECAPLITVNRNEHYKIGMVGLALPGYEIKIQDGEIYVKGTSLMSGYYKNEELTKEAIENGWFKTGDLGHIDDDGFLAITGRKKNVIVLKNGKKVSPEELELILSGIPIIKEALVYGSSVGNAADDVVPAVTIYPDPELSKGKQSYEILSEIQAEVDLINEKLPTFKQIRLINLRENEFEKTSSKKIKRKI